MPLRAHLGVSVAQSLLASSEPAERLRGIARLGGLGTPEAIDTLLDSMEQGSPVSRDPRARLEAVRTLAPHATRDPVRQLLTRELNDGAGAPGRGTPSPLTELIRGTAALALARAGDKPAITVLVSALVQGGAPGGAAERALLANPPSSLELLLGGKKPPPPELARFLGELGDLRATARLRLLLAGKDVTVQIVSALALAKLGDESALARARDWLRKPEPRTLPAAAEILVHLGAPEAPAAVNALLKGETTRLDGLRLAEILPTPALAPQLAQAIPLLPETARPRAVAALGRAGGPQAVNALRALLGQAPLATPAAFALATLPGDAARKALADLLAAPDVARDGARRRLLLRAAIVRALVLRDPPVPLEEHLQPLLGASSSDPDRAVAAFGLAALDADVLEDLSRRCLDAVKRPPVAPHATPALAPSPPRPRKVTPPPCDTSLLQAAARGSLAHGSAARAPLAALRELLEQLTASGASAPEHRAPSDETAARTLITAGLALLDAPGGGAVPTSQLAAWAEAGGALAPLAARALATRDDAVVRGTLERLLGGSDPVIRAHVALGLGSDPEPDSVSLLASAYRFEEDPAVRRAIVRGLSRRAEAQRRQTLTLARDLDPDPSVRALARAALEGRPLDPAPTPLATGVLWVTVTPNDPGAAAAAAGRAGRFIRPDGVALPILTDPEGVLLVPGVPPGPGVVTLASALTSGEPSPR
ncbi:HEAT repeat domain-containing protein [Chondromyces apiculatus]|nr:HEAT repeat domain-containing protein [Chondromyces apiculatus]